MFQPDSLHKLVDSSLDGKGTVFSQIKIDILALLSVVFALTYGWSLSRIINFSAWQYFGLTLFCGILYLIVFFYKALFIPDSKISAFMTLLDSVALIVFFANSNWVLFVVFLFIFLLLLVSNRAGRWTMVNNMKISFWRVGYVVLPKAMIALFLIPSVFLPLKYQEQKEDFPVPKSVFNAVIGSSQKAVNIFLPGFDMGNSIEDSTKQMVSERIKANEQLKALSASTTDKIVKENQNSIYKDISNWLGINIDPKLNLSENLYLSAKQKYSVQTDGIKSLIFLLIGLLIFLSLASLLLPVRIVVAAIAWVGYEFLISFGFARVVVQQVEKEMIELE